MCKNADFSIEIALLWTTEFSAPISVHTQATPLFVNFVPAANFQQRFVKRTHPEFPTPSLFFVQRANGLNGFLLDGGWILLNPDLQVDSGSHRIGCSDATSWPPVRATCPSLLNRFSDRIFLRNESRKPIRQSMTLSLFAPDPSLFSIIARNPRGSTIFSPLFHLLGFSPPRFHFGNDFFFEVSFDVWIHLRLRVERLPRNIYQ